MLKIAELSTENALTLAKNLLMTFKVLCENVNATPSENYDSTLPLLTTVNCFSYKAVKIILAHTLNGEENLFQEPTNHVYKFNWYNRLFYVTFHSSPEVYGYYSALPNFDTTPYLFCSIIEMKSRTQKKCLMNFGFNPETKTFLELFDIEDYSVENLIKECWDTNSIEHKIRGKILF